MIKVGLRVSAALALAMFTSSPLIAAKLRLPPPTAPKDKIYSPGAIAKDLEKRGYRIDKMQRKGTTYSITATGPNKNRVQMTVDGRSGDIVGLAVLQAVANLASAIAAIVKSGKGSRYVDDWHPFGIVVPGIYQTRWTSITTWTDYSTEYVSESWSGAGYRFAVPYDTIRPGHAGYSVTTLEASKMNEPIYDVYDYNGSEVVTEYSEASVEISEASSFESRYEAENEQSETSYLDGSIDESEDSDAAEVADYDSEDGDFDTADNSSDGYDGDIADDDGAEDALDADDSGDEIGEDADPDVADDADDSNDEGDDMPDDADDGGDDSDDGDDPEKVAGR